LLGFCDDKIRGCLLHIGRESLCKLLICWHNDMLIEDKSSFTCVLLENLVVQRPSQLLDRFSKELKSLIEELSHFKAWLKGPTFSF
jgi:hypothetical protein